MQFLKTKEADVFISDDCMEEEKSVPYVRLDNESVFNFLKYHPQIAEGLALYSQLRGLKGLAVLDAHGGVDGKHWVYYDGNKRVRIQTWINKCDGVYAALLTLSCNPGGLTPQSKKSMLIIPDRNVAVRDFGTGRGAQFTMIVPGIGEIDSYSVDYFLNKWREELEDLK